MLNHCWIEFFCLHCWITELVLVSGLLNLEICQRLAPLIMDWDPLDILPAWPQWQLGYVALMVYSGTKKEKNYTQILTLIEVSLSCAIFLQSKCTLCFPGYGVLTDDWVSTKTWVLLFVIPRICVHEAYVLRKEWSHNK